MAANTKARSQEIYTAACSALEQVGGVSEVDKIPSYDRGPILRKLYGMVVETTGCHYDTAKRNVAKALRKGRFAEIQKWGGTRPGAGYPKGKPRKMD